MQTLKFIGQSDLVWLRKTVPRTEWVGGVKMQHSLRVCVCVCPEVCVFVPQVVHQPNDRERLLQLLHQPDQWATPERHTWTLTLVVSCFILIFCFRIPGRRTSEAFLLGKRVSEVRLNPQPSTLWKCSPSVANFGHLDPRCFLSQSGSKVKPTLSLTQPGLNCSVGF